MVQTLGAVPGSIEKLKTSTEQYKNVLVHNTVLLEIYCVDFTA